MSEIWKDIQGYEGLYQVSNLGNVKSLPRRKTIKTERILKYGINNKGYKYVILCKDSKPKEFRVHRLIAIAFIPNPENKPHINHIDAIRLNNDLSNLEWCTPSENIKHAFKIGTANNRGEKSPRAILKEKDVLTIREMYATKMYTQKDLGEIFKCSETNIFKVVNRVNWVHI